MRKNIVLLLISVAAVIEISGIPFEDCGSVYNLQQVDIAQCPRAPCKLTVGNNVNVTAKFAANIASRRLNNAVHFFLHNVEVDTDVQDHTCPSEGTCVGSNQTMAYTAEMAVSDDLPTTNGQLVWQIRNENAIQVICFKVAIYLIV